MTCWKSFCWERRAQARPIDKQDFRPGLDFRLSMVLSVISRDNATGRSTTRGGQPQTSNQTRGRAPFGSLSTGRVSFFHGFGDIGGVQVGAKGIGLGVWSYTSITDKGQQVKNDVIVCGCDRNEPTSKFRYMRLAACSGHRGMDLAFVSAFSRDLALELCTTPSEHLEAFLV